MHHRTRSLRGPQATRARGLIGKGIGSARARSPFAPSHARQGAQSHCSSASAAVDAVTTNRILWADAVRRSRRVDGARSRTRVQESERWLGARGYGIAQVDPPERTDVHEGRGTQVIRWRSAAASAYPLMGVTGCFNGEKWWARQDSNLRPRDYEFLGITVSF